MCSTDALSSGACRHGRLRHHITASPDNLPVRNSSWFPEFSSSPWFGWRSGRALAHKNCHPRPWPEDPSNCGLGRSSRRKVGPHGTSGTTTPSRSLCPREKPTDDTGGWPGRSRADQDWRRPAGRAGVTRAINDLLASPRGENPAQILFLRSAPVQRGPAAPSARDESGTTIFSALKPPNRPSGSRGPASAVAERPPSGLGMTGPLWPDRHSRNGQRRHHEVKCLHWTTRRPRYVRP